MDFTRPQFERNTLERANGTKGFADVMKCQQRFQAVKLADSLRWIKRSG
jgi:hypothetical protein